MYMYINDNTISTGTGHKYDKNDMERTLLLD